MKKVNVAVIGVGKLGQHHARIYKEIENANLIGIVDNDKKRAEKISNWLDVPYFLSYEDVLDKVESVSIAVPTPLHYKIGKVFLEKGIHTLIEKPICENLEEARHLKNTADNKKLVLQIGHIERYNPAVRKALEFIKKPKYIEAHRLGPYDPRVAETDVVLDLMIHDLDIILYLVNSKLKNFDAVGAKVLSRKTDIACAYLKFENGTYVNITTSRITKKSMRKIRIFQEDTYISLNYAKPSLKIYKKKKEVVKSFLDIKYMKPKLKKEEPLKLELNDFISTVVERRKPLVGGKEALSSLELALKILEKIEENK